MPRVGAEGHVPNTEYSRLPEKVPGVQTYNWAEAMAWLRVLQHVPPASNLHAHGDPDWSHDVTVPVK